MSNLMSTEERLKKIEESVNRIEIERELSRNSMPESDNELYSDLLRLKLLTVISDEKEKPFELPTFCEKLSPKTITKWKKDWESNKRVNPREIFHEIVNHLNEENEYCEIFRESVYFSNNLFPDFVFNFKNQPCVPYFFVFIAQLRVGNEAKASVVKCNYTMLDANPRRNFVLSFVTDLDDLVFIKSERDNGKIFNYEYHPIKFWDVGIHLIKCMLRSHELCGCLETCDLKFKINESNYFIHQYAVFIYFKKKGHVK